MIADHCKEDPPVTCGFPSKRESNAENVSTSWRYHERGDLLTWYKAAEDEKLKTEGVDLARAGKGSHAVSWTLQRACLGPGDERTDGASVTRARSRREGNIQWIIQSQMIKIDSITCYNSMAWWSNHGPAWLYRESGVLSAFQGLSMEVICHRPISYNCCFIGLRPVARQISGHWVSQKLENNAVKLANHGLFPKWSLLKRMKYIIILSSDQK